VSVCEVFDVIVLSESVHVRVYVCARDGFATARARGIVSFD